MDRYAASGAVYTAANTGRSLKWCQQADIGLPKPDCVMFLKVSKRQQELRSDWGKERFEHDEFQQRVVANYEKLKDNTWIIINADQDESTVHAEILQKTLSIIQEVQFRNIELLDDESDWKCEQVSVFHVSLFQQRITTSVILFAVFAINKILIKYELYHFLNK